MTTEGTMHFTKYSQPLSLRRAIYPKEAHHAERSRQSRNLPRPARAARRFIIPNPWDAGTARLLAALGFEALATTSLGLANMLGRLTVRSVARR